MDTARVTRLTRDPHVTRNKPRRQAGAGWRWLASRFQEAALSPASVRLELWDGSSPYEERRPPVGDLIVHDRRTLIALMLNPDLAFGEAYMSGRATIRGSLTDVVESLTRYAARDVRWRDSIRVALSWPGTLERARRNVHHHYDLGNDFYRSGSTASWSTHARISRSPPRHSTTRSTPSSISSAASCGCVPATASLRRVAAGGRWRCTWPGTMAFRVRAFNVSREQLAYARDRAEREGLADRVEFIDDDYRSVTGEFDVFVSVGMLEHVGLHISAALRTSSGGAVSRERRPGLLHFIGRDAPRPLNPWIRRRIFPGAYPPTLAEVTTDILTPAGMSVIDVENLRLHYAQTLAHWSRAVRGRQGGRARDDTARSSSGPGSSTWPARRRRSPPGGCSCFRSCSHPSNRPRPTGRDRRYTTFGRGVRVIQCDALIVGGGPAGSTCARALRLAGWDVVVLDRGRFPRDKVCGGWITPEVFPLLDSHPDDYRATGLTLQEITGFRTGLIDRRRLVETRYSDSSATPSADASSTTSCFDAPGSCARGHAALDAAARTATRGLPTSQIVTPVVVGAGGHFCPVARHLQGGRERTSPRHCQGSGVRAPWTNTQRDRIPIRRNCSSAAISKATAGACGRTTTSMSGSGGASGGDFGDHVREFVSFLAETGRVPRAVPPRLARPCVSRDGRRGPAARRAMACCSRGRSRARLSRERRRHTAGDRVGPACRRDSCRSQRTPRR